MGLPVHTAIAAQGVQIRHATFGLVVDISRFFDRLFFGRSLHIILQRF